VIGAATAAVVIPVVSMLAVWLARKVGRWIARSLSNSFAGVVLDVMAPDMAHLGVKVSASIDELRQSNTSDHTETGDRLTDVEHRLTDVEHRLAGVETRLAPRPPDARTRSTD
jgi:hypothetical protein